MTLITRIRFSKIVTFPWRMWIRPPVNLQLGAETGGAKAADVKASRRQQGFTRDNVFKW